MVKRLIRSPSEAAERRFITREIRQILTERPNISAKFLCDELGIPYNKYKQVIWNERCKLRKLISSRATPSTPSKVFHALRLKADLGEEVYRKARASCEGRPRGFGCWYLTENRNGELAFVNDWILAWLFPTGRFRAQLKRGVSSLPEALSWARVCLLALGMSEEDIAKVEFEMSRHRVFYIGKPLPPFRVDAYKKPLGLEIYADGSHPLSLETTESYPDWARAVVKVEKTLEAIHQSSLTTQQLVKAMAEEVHYVAVLLNVLLEREKPKFSRDIYY